MVRHYAELFFQPEGKKHGDFCLIEKDNALYDIFLENDKAEGSDDGVVSRGNNHGLAVSSDGLRWDYVGTILSPGERGRWDDRSLWACQVFEKAGMFRMIYSAIADKEDPFPTQQFGMAMSVDLTNWQKMGTKPVLKNTDTGEHYHGKDVSRFCWRDANVHQVDDGYAVILAARDAEKEVAVSGCVGLLLTKDFKSWETKPPIFSPGKYDELETPHIYEVDGRWVLLFGENGPGMSMRFAFADSQFGNYVEPSLNLFTPTHCYAGVMISLEGKWHFYHWIMDRNGGKNERYLCPPKLVEIRDEFIFLKKEPRIDQFYDETPGEDVLTEIDKSHDDKIVVKRTLADSIKLGVQSNNEEYHKDVTITKVSEGVVVDDVSGDLKESRTIPMQKDEMGLELFFHDRFLEIYCNGYLVYATVLENDYDALTSIDIS